MKAVVSPTWRRRRREKEGKSSRTAGILKGETCTTNPRKKWYFAGPFAATRGPEYAKYHELAKLYNRAK